MIQITGVIQINLSFGFNERGLTARNSLRFGLP